MNTEQIYALLIEANPVPDPHRTVDPADVSLRLVDERTTPVQTIERTPEHDIERESDDERRRTRWITAAAAAIVVVGIGALVVLTTGENEPAEPVDQPAPTVDLPVGVDPDAAEAAAVAAANFYGAVQERDIDTVIEMSNPYSNLVADRAMWEMNAYLAENDLGGDIGDCRALEGDAQRVIAACELTVTNPVWTTLGITDLLLPIQYDAEDTTVIWRPYLASDGTGLDFSAANQAVVEYLREFHPEQYDATCSPSAYEWGAVKNGSGLALTEECARVWAPLVDDIAAWVVDTGYGS